MPLPDSCARHVPVVIPAARSHSRSTMGTSTTSPTRCRGWNAQPHRPRYSSRRDPWARLSCGMNSSVSSWKRLRCRPSWISARATRDHSWRLGVREVDDEGHRRWDVRAAPSSPREVLFSSLWGLLRPLEPAPREEILANLGRWSDAAAPISATTRCMTAHEVNEIAASGLVEIGAHTVNHPVLAALSHEDQVAEVEESALALEDILGVRPNRLRLSVRGDCRLRPEFGGDPS